MFQQLLANKHHRLRDFKAPITIWPSGGLGLVTDKKTKKNNKSRVKQEPRSAHGRAVNKHPRLRDSVSIKIWSSGGLGLVTDKKTKKKSRAEQEPRSAHGRAVNK